MRRWCLGALAAMLTASHGCSVVEVPGPVGIGAEGDPCGPPGSLACTQDGTTELICIDGILHIGQNCPGGCNIAPSEGPDASSLTCSDEDGAALRSPEDAGY